MLALSDEPRVLTWTLTSRIWALVMQEMENAPVFVIAIIIAAAIIVAHIEGEAGTIRREENPRGYWFLMLSGMGALGGLLIWSLAE